MQNKTILIVDDTPENIYVLAELLSDYNRLTANSGKAALEIISKSKVDLILLDVMMPGMDGFEVAKILKSDPDTAGIPIIFVTAKNDVDSFVAGFELGAEDYIMKPVDPNVVIQVVQRKFEAVARS